MDDDESRGVKDRVDEFVRDAHTTAMGLDWDLNPHEILKAYGRPRTKRARRRASVVLVAAAILVVFFVPLPHVSLFGRIVAPAKQPIPTSLPKGPLPKAQALLPARYSFFAVSQTGFSLELTGLDVPSTIANPPANAKCVSARLDESTLRLYDLAVAICPAAGSSSPYWEVESAQFTNHATARIAHRDRRTGKIVLGPVIMTWKDSSDSHPESIVGDGSLWLFDAATAKGSEVLRVSETTGQVENTIPIPGGLFRPILATDDDGLWMGVATNGGYAEGLPGSPIYHIAVGSNVAKIVFTGGHATSWMVASGHTLWDDILTVSTPGGQVSQAIWRFDGPGAKRVFHASTQLPYGVTVIGDEAEGLWTVASQLQPGSSPNADTDTDCTGVPAVVYINPDTGRQRVVTTIPVGSVGSGNAGYGCENEDLAESQGVIVAGDLYILEDTLSYDGSYTEVLRIPVATSLRGTAGSVAAVRPQVPGPLAIGPNGNLYISDAARDQVLELLPSGRFRVVAGDGRSGFSGDGGPALTAELRLGGGGLAFSKDGTLYIADSGNDRVRAVSPDGVMTTVLGDGASPRPQAAARPFAPTPARRFALGSPRALSVAPNGDLYVAATDIIRLGPGGLVTWVAGGKVAGSPPGSGLIESEFGNSTGVAVDGRGNVFVVNPISFGVAEITTSGALVNLGRSFGFGVPDRAAVTTTPNGEVVVAGLNGLFEITPSGRVLTIRAQPRLGGGIGFVPFGVAASSSGVIYEDTNPLPQWTHRSAIVSITHGAKARVFWSSAQ